LSAAPAWADFLAAWPGFSTVLDVFIIQI